jgi:hypothetical protein
MTTPKRKRTKLKTPQLTVLTIELAKVLFVRMIKIRENAFIKNKKCAGTVELSKLASTVKLLRLQLVIMKSTPVLVKWVKNFNVLI